jgi:hypothetical protein
MGDHGRAYYRFWIAQRWKSAQHRLLVDLENSGQMLYYAAPGFHEQAVFSAEFLNESVTNRSAFVSPAEIRLLVDDDRHCVVFGPRLDAAWFCSETRPISLVSREDLDRSLANRIKEQRTVATTELALELRQMISPVVEGLPSLDEKSIPLALNFISLSLTSTRQGEVFFSPSDR